MLFSCCVLFNYCVANSIETLINSECVILLLNKMPIILIRDVPVVFPFEPHEVQREYMKKVIESLDKSQNAVLESPTGLSYFCHNLG